MTEKAKSIEVEDVPENTAPSLAQQVQEVEGEVVTAMLKAAEPILQAHGYGGFKDLQLISSKPDEEGRIQQSLKVSL